MKYINLTQGKIAIVDDEDYLFLTTYKWTYIKDNISGHAYRKVNGKSIYMHRVLMHSKKGQIVDHVNRNGLDNRKCNLRHVTSRQNALNKDVLTNSLSGYKGISWDKKSNKWLVRVMYYRKGINLGRYSDIKEAIKARKLGESKYFYL